MSRSGFAADVMQVVHQGFRCGAEVLSNFTMIALEKAEISFQLMMQVRNKIVNAYETIMRTNI